MADIIFIAVAICIALGLLVKVLVTAYRVWNNHPVNVELIPINNSKHAGTVNLGLYVDIISKQFSEILDN
ncbi:hypothetical protein [Treponema sp. R80B11-R83G3]